MLSRYEILRETALFNALDERELSLLAAALQERSIPGGQQLIKQGEPASHVFWLMSGVVQVIVHDEIVAQVSTIQCFGEMSCLVPDSVGSATVLSIGNCTILSIDKTNFLEVLSAIPKLWRSLFEQTSKRLASSNKRFSEVLAHVPQGFMKLNKSACITQEYSERCLRYFDTANLAGKSFTSLLQMDDPSEVQSWMYVYGLLFEDGRVPFGDLAALLTRECRLETGGRMRDYLFSYYPSAGTDGHIEAIDVGIEDVTEIRQLELSNAALIYEQAVLGKIYSDPESFLTLLDLMKESVSDSEELLAINENFESAAYRSQIEITMRSLHSLKGLSGVFGLESVQRCCNEMANLIRELELHLAQLAPADRIALFSEFGEDFKRALSLLTHEVGHANALQNKIGENLLKRLKGVVLSQLDFDKLKSHLKAAEIKSALMIIEAAQQREVAHLFNNWNVKVDLMARSLSKSVRFTLTGPGGIINKDLYLALDSVLVHMMNNALDHGIELPDEREDHGKAREGLIQAEVGVRDRVLEIVLRDDGCGVDFNQLVPLARTKPGIDQVAVSRIERDGELWRILLLPGFTTSSLVTRYSGYGVGLDSLQKMVLSHAGSVTMSSVVGEGLAVHIKIPLELSAEDKNVS